MPHRHRVVVTGVGVVSALGIGTSAHCSALKEGRTGITPIELIRTEGLAIPIAAEAKAFRAEDYFQRSDIALKDRVTQMSIVAGREAVKASGIEFTEELGLRTGTIIGTSMGGQHTQDDNYRMVYRENKQRVHPFTVPRLMANAAACYLSMEFGLKGPSWSVSTACASSNHALGQAFHMVRSGMIDAAVTGGAESGLTYGVMKAWEGLRVMSRDTCRPFSKNRTGMVQGEGAAILVLETLEHARKRGADILGEIVGFGMTADAADIVQPSVDGAARAIKTALHDSELNFQDVEYINAHGTATTVNDKTECEAIHNVFGNHAKKLMISSTKSMHGHCIGAAGALEMVATLTALNEGIIPPTINYEEPDPNCNLDVVPNVARDKKINIAMSNSFAFGGLNAVLVARRFIA